ncbi:glycosyltransferase family 2 protein [Halobacillus sp. BBL2006]|uniref:glycosyltransferase n=1 Tax=Halobacillus sp. BBL2006 TaxID=1543706 RepID=UPI0005420A75|nr:glycosyltransferase [Halobacillus sp. BBL2006]KHE71426.1 hydroxy-3,4-dehydro-apo-8'-lycopene glucosyltransferase [Halobacillus sp. BBL2006]
MLFTILLIVTSVLNIWTIMNSLFLIPLSSPKFLSKQPKVSLLVPLRNEEDNVEGLIQSLRKLTYPSLEILLLDDHSTDDTYSLLLHEVKGDARFTIHQGKELPDGWNGKVHACHQLSQWATGTYFLFLDADARVAPTVIEQTLATMEQHKANMLSGFPHYPNNHFLSHMLVPLQHMVIQLHLPLAIANFTNRPLFTAACGIFIMIDRKTYETVGGHASVKGSLVEDVHLAREVKKKGYKMVLANITPAVLSYMYSTASETWEGFNKNIYTGLGRSIPMVIALSLFYSIVFLLPLGYLFAGLIQGSWIYILPYLLTVAFKMYVDARTGHPLWLSFFVPISIVLLIAIMFSSMFIHLKGHTYTWKGRSYE